MKISLTMPQFGESITQARIVHWLKEEGESVKELEPIVEMETEKAVFAYESPFRGKLVKILEGDDAEVPVGKEIAQFEVSEQDGKKYLSLGVGQTAPSQPSPVVVPTSGRETTVPQRGTAKLSPLVRSLAKEHGISIEEAGKIPGTGPGGRVTKDDFEKFVSVRQVPLSPIRSRIADNMVLSKKIIPHAACSIDVDLNLIQAWRSGREKAPSYVAFAIVAVLKALRSHPLINSVWREADGRRWIETYEEVHMGIAVATEQGLMVPVIRNAHRLSFWEIVKEMERLIEGGRKGGLNVGDLTGATITVNNTGAVGAVRSQQIVPPGQASIVAFNRVVRRPWVVGDKVEIRPVMGLDITFDHRVIDGDQAGRFLTDAAKNLENFDFSQIGSD